MKVLVKLDLILEQKLIPLDNLRRQFAGFIYSWNICNGSSMKHSRNRFKLVLWRHKIYAAILKEKKFLRQQFTMDYKLHSSKKHAVTVKTNSAVRSSDDSSVQRKNENFLKTILDVGYYSGIIPYHITYDTSLQDFTIRKTKTQTVSYIIYLFMI